MGKRVAKKAPPKLSAFAEMIGEDIQDALDHKLSAGEITIALLVYAAAIAIQHADIDAEEYMNWAAEAWNDRLERLAEGETPMPCSEGVEN